MIKSFKHKGLEKFYTSGSTKGIQSNHAKKLRMQLAALDTAQSVDEWISQDTDYINLLATREVSGLLRYKQTGVLPLSSGMATYTF